MPTLRWQTAPTRPRNSDCIRSQQSRCGQLRSALLGAAEILSTLVPDDTLSGGGCKGRKSGVGRERLRPNRAARVTRALRMTRSEQIENDDDDEDDWSKAGAKLVGGRERLRPNRAARVTRALRMTRPEQIENENDDDDEDDCLR